METVVRVIVGLKVAGLVLFAVVLVTSFAYTMAVGPEEPESTHGSTAVCKDGTVLEPPWNVCGESHGYLDHWTTAPLLPSANPVIPAESPAAAPLDTDEDDWLTAYPNGCSAGTPVASPWNPCG
ncbi:hypothetical protein ABZ760_03720 [Streptomyces sp. NPDC006658]|uniref:hypothetical protein n=1 Tax=Streptomyces sp. NPDC006658 TaxID=3156900 RepID=UPI0033CF0CCB